MKNWVRVKMSNYPHSLQSKYTLWLVLAALSILLLHQVIVIAHMLSVMFSSFDMTHISSFESEELVNRPNSPPLIPKIIHQVYLGNYLAGEVDSIQASKSFHAHWKRYYIHKGWDVKLWKDEDVNKLVEAEYPWIRDQYKYYNNHIQRADIARYLILYHYGGVYVDMDAKPANEFDLSRLRRVNLVTALSSDGLLLTNHFFMAVPRSPFLWKVLKFSVESNVLFLLPYLQVFYSTGPMLFTRAFKSYISEKESAAFHKEIVDRDYVQLMSSSGSVGLRQSSYTTSMIVESNYSNSIRNSTSEASISLKNRNAETVGAVSIERVDSLPSNGSSLVAAVNDHHNQHSAPTEEGDKESLILLLTGPQLGLYVVHMAGRSWLGLDGQLFNWLVNEGYVEVACLVALAVAVSIVTGYAITCICRCRRGAAASSPSGGCHGHDH